MPSVMYAAQRRPTVDPREDEGEEHVNSMRSRDDALETSAQQSGSG
jgi:hypothetical protein